MPNVAVRVILFLSSYAPLFLILVVRDSFRNCWVSVGLLVVAMLSLAVLFFYLRVVRRLAAVPVTVAAVSARDGDAMSYLVTYLLPFLDISFSDLRNAASLIIMLVVLGVLYVNSNLIHTNPILNLCGFHIFDIETAEGNRLAFISRRSYIRVGVTLGAVSLGDYVMMERV